MRIAIASAAFPPNLDGVGDYSWWLAGTLAESLPTTVFTRQGEFLPAAEVNVVSLFDRANLSTVALLPDALAKSGLTESGDWLVFQYNPFSWGRRGWCPEVPRTLAEIKRRFPQLGLAVMFHETSVPRWPWRFTIMRLWQRRFFRTACGLSDVAFASSERYVRQISRVGTRGPIVHLPVGSNIAKCTLSKNEARARLDLSPGGTYVGVFGTAHESRLLDWIASAFRAIQAKVPEAKILYVGPEGEAVSRALGGRESLIDLGVQSADTAGVAFAAMDLLLVPFADGISTRRGSAIAALQHGIPVATTISRWTDSQFRKTGLEGLLLSTADSADAFAQNVASWSDFLTDAEKSARYHAAIQDFHQRVFAWPVIAEALQNTLLKSSSARPAHRGIVQS